MSRFWYVADGQDGRRQYVEAGNLPDALLRLRASGIAVTSAGAEAPPTGRLYHVSARALPTVYPQLAALLDDGTPLPLALRQLAQESRDRQVQRSLHAVADDVDLGATLSEAMSAQPYVFDEATVQAVAAGEMAGDLGEGLRRLNDHQEEMARIAEQVAFPLVYPVVITGIVFALMLFLVNFIVPKFMSLFKELGMTEDKFPAPTLFLIWASRAIPWAVFVVGVPAVCLYLAYYFYRGTRRGRFDLRRWRLRIPLLEQIGLHTALGRVASVLSMLLDQGVDTGKSLRIAGKACGSETVSLALRRAAGVVDEGGSLAEGLRSTKLLPEAFVFSLGTAEIGGNVPTTLTQLVETYQRRSRRLVRTWITVAGPLIVVCLGFMLLFIAFGLFAPLIGITEGLSK